MENSRFLLRLLAAAALGWPAAAAANPVDVGQEGALAEILAPAPGSRLCFARHYDAGHLDGHPDQQVTAILFDLEYFRHEPDEFFPQGQRNYYFTLGVTLRDESEMLFTAGECMPGEGTIWCGVDDDGGGILLARRGGDEILIDLEATGRLRVGPADGSEVDTSILEPGLDDKQFLLEEAAETECQPLRQLYADE